MAEEVVTHVLYVDDSGTKEYSATGTYGTAGNTRHFVFAGAFLTAEDAKSVTSRLRRLKLEVFKTENVEIKSNWLRLKQENDPLLAEI